MTVKFALLRCLPFVVVLGAPPFAASAGAKGTVDFDKQILPIFERACTSCHGDAKHSAGLRLHDPEGIRKGGITGPLIEPGRGKESYLVQRLLGLGDEDQMPIKADPLPEKEIALITRWIDEGGHLPREKSLVFTPAPPGVRQLSPTQFQNAIRDLLGIPAPPLPESDGEAERFSTNESFQLSVSSRAVEGYITTVYQIVRGLFADQKKRERLVGCTPQQHTNDRCVTDFLSRFGRRAWRRPLTATELNRYLDVVGRVGKAPNSPWAGLEAATTGLLQSPHFLYSPELGTPDPKRPGWLRYTDYEMASRLSFFFWNSVPDDQLLDAAQKGDLSSLGDIETQAKRLWASPKAREGVRNFFLENLQLTHLHQIGKKKKIFPLVTKSLFLAMREEVERLVDHLVFEKPESILRLFDTRETFVNAELGTLYGIKLPPGAGFQKVTLPADGPRAGFLTTAAFLATNGIFDRSSPTMRGVFVRERLFCQEVPQPPPDVDVATVDNTKRNESKTLRERIAEHVTNPACANCHAFFDPIGLSLEHFDAIGAHRTKEKGADIDVSGAIDGKTFVGSRALADMIANDPRTPACLTQQLYQYATGHDAYPEEKPLLADLARKLETSGHDFQTLMIAVAASEGFRYAKAPTKTAR